jgi:heme-degrading monooxygenase HmoA
MIVTLFWSRFRDDMGEEKLAAYGEDVARMKEIAESFPGFVSIKSYTADDGERLSVVQFESEEARREFRDLPVHREIQQKARDNYYAWYRAMTCESRGELAWAVGDDAD